MNKTVPFRIREISLSLRPYLFLLFALPGAVCGEEERPDTEWQTIQHPAFVLFVPEDWEIANDPENQRISATSPLTEPQDPYRETLLVNIVQIEPSQSLSQFADQLCTSLEQNEDGFTVLNRGPAQIGKHSGLQIEASYDEGGHIRHLRIFLIQKENRVYSLSIRGENSDLGGLESVFEQIIANLYPFPKQLGQVYYHQFFLIHLPANWTVKEGLPGTHIAGISPETDPLDPFRERITIGSQPLESRATFDEKVESTFDNLLEKLPRARERDRTTMRVAGVDAPTLELSHFAYREETILRVTMFPRNDRIFVAICSGREPDYSGMIPIFDEILNSFASISPPGKDPSHP